MNRGVISLTKAEIDYLLTLLSKDNPQHAHLMELLQIAEQNKDESKTIQVTQEQVEIMLDNLGMPMEGEAETVQTLRTKCQAALSTMNA